MANLIGVVGPSGSGKSRSIKNLDPKTTYIAKVLNKPLPFPGSSAMYAKENKNSGHIKDYGAALHVLKTINEEKPHVKTIVFDDIGHLMVKEAFGRSGEKGYEKYMDIGRHMYDLIMYSQELREDLNIIFVFHEDLDNFKIKTVGKVLDNWFDPQEAFTVCIYSTSSENEDGTFSYHFVTNKVIVNGKAFKHAKSPEGMFGTQLIENDLNTVIDTITKYNNTQQ